MMQLSLFDVPEPIIARNPRVDPASPSLSHVSAELEVGRAAEYLVCADLILAGWTAFVTDQGVPYDLIVDTGHERIRVQVKATLAPKCPGYNQLRITPAYFFHTRRAGRGGKRRYDVDEFDVYAFVALDRRQVAYIAAADLPNQTLVLRIPGIHYGVTSGKSRDFDGSTFERALNLWRIAQAARLERSAMAKEPLSRCDVSDRGRNSRADPDSVD